MREPCVHRNDDDPEIAYSYEFGMWAGFDERVGTDLLQDEGEY